MSADFGCVAACLRLQGATISTLGTRMQFDFAVGIGEPAAAGTVFPSLVVLLALLASSVYLLL